MKENSFFVGCLAIMSQPSTVMKQVFSETRKFEELFSCKYSNLHLYHIPSHVPNLPWRLTNTQRWARLLPWNVIYIWYRHEKLFVLNISRHFCPAHPPLILLRTENPSGSSQLSSNIRDEADPIENRFRFSVDRSRSLYNLLIRAAFRRDSISAGATPMRESWCNQMWIRQNLQLPKACSATTDDSASTARAATGVCKLRNHVLSPSNILQVPNRSYSPSFDQDCITARFAFPPWNWRRIRSRRKI